MTAQQEYVTDCLRAAAYLLHQGVSDEFLAVAWDAYMVGADMVPICDAATTTPIAPEACSAPESGPYLMEENDDRS